MSDRRVSERLAELQLTLGEGPSLDTSASGGPALASDLADPESASRWPAFTPAACQAGAAAVFTFPLAVGAMPGCSACTGNGQGR